MRIPFNKPYIGIEEEEALVRVLREGSLQGDGAHARRVQQSMQEWLGADHVFLTTSCTHALEIAVLALGIGPGDEVIMPSFNFVSSANAVVLRGARPVFADIEPMTMNIDPAEIEKKITPRTKAVIVVHYAGVGCDMDAIVDIARRHDLWLIEDAAQGIDACYKGVSLGTIGDIGCYSFHDTKNITCGEGGAFVTSDRRLAKKAEIIREKGTNRAAFFRGEIDKYSWVDVGSSYVLSDLLAGMLEIQLTKREEIKAKRKVVWENYLAALSPLADEGRVILPVVPEECESNYHIFYFHVREPEIRQLAIDALKEAGIHATFHYVPLHNSPKGREMTDHEVNLERTDHFSNTLVRLPLYPQLEKMDLHLEVKKILDKTL